MRRTAGILSSAHRRRRARARSRRRSRGTPRIANRLLRRVRDYAQVKADGKVDEGVAKAAMDLLEVDPHGFDTMDRRLLLAVIEKFDGGPVGIESLAAALGEERGTLEDVVEPYLDPGRVPAAHVARPDCDAERPICISALRCRLRVTGRMRRISSIERAAQGR